MVALACLGALACKGGGGAFSSGGGGTPPRLGGQGLQVRAMQPDHGTWGDVVLLEGSGFAEATGVTLGGVPVARFKAKDDNNLFLLVPQEARGGPMTVAVGSATATSATPFRLVPRTPTLNMISPGRGPVGTPVVLSGTQFIQGMSVKFGSIPAGGVTVTSPTRAVVPVPSGASDGPITVTNPTGTVTSQEPFEVTFASTSLDIYLQGLVLTQGSLRDGVPLPLVAGRDAMLLASVLANKANLAKPVLRVHLLDGLGEYWTQDAMAQEPSVPLALDPSDLGTFRTLRVPGAMIRPGMRVWAELDPDRLVPEVDRRDNSWPPSGAPMAYEVRSLAPFRVTLVPVVYAGVTGRVDTGGRTLDAWTAPFKAMYPIGALEVRKGSPLYFTGKLDGDGGGWGTLLSELEMKRLIGMEVGQRYYGVVHVPYTSGLAGLGMIGSPSDALGRSAVGWDWDGEGSGLQSFAQILAHEFGHVLGREHAPCTPVSVDQAGLDPAYPYPAADIGSYGFDVAAGALKLPGLFKDIMGYCPPKWISDYTYDGTLAFLSNPVQNFLAPGASLEEVLLVPGQVTQGRADLWPALSCTLRPQPPQPGDLTLEGLDAAGAVALRVPFRAYEGHPFVLQVPASAQVQASLRSLRVVRGGAVLGTLAATGAFQREVRPPEARALGPALTHLSWDGEAHPRVVVRDAGSGEILAFGTGGSLDLPVPAASLEVAFSDGVRSRSQLLPVTPAP